MRNKPTAPPHSPPLLPIVIAVHGYGAALANGCQGSGIVIFDPFRLDDSGGNLLDVEAGQDEGRSPQFGTPTQPEASARARLRLRRYRGRSVRPISSLSMAWAA